MAEHELIIKSQKRLKYSRYSNKCKNDNYTENKMLVPMDNTLDQSLSRNTEYIPCDSQKCQMNMLKWRTSTQNHRKSLSVSNKNNNRNIKDMSVCDNKCAYDLFLRHIPKFINGYSSSWRRCFVIFFFCFQIIFFKGASATIGEFFYIFI